jgi:hypothetical protein
MLSRTITIARTVITLWPRSNRAICAPPIEHGCANKTGSSLTFMRKCRHRRSGDPENALPYPFRAKHELLHSPSPICEIAPPTRSTTSTSGPTRAPTTRRPRCRPISIGNSASSSSSLATEPTALRCSERSEGRGFNPLNRHHVRSRATRRISRDHRRRGQD